MEVTKEFTCPLNAEIKIQNQCERSCMYNCTLYDTHCMIAQGSTLLTIDEATDLAYSVKGLELNLTPQEVQKAALKASNRILQAVNIQRLSRFIAVTNRPQPKADLWCELDRFWPFTCSYLAWSDTLIQACVNADLWKQVLKTDHADINSITGIKPRLIKLITDYYQ